MLAANSLFYLNQGIPPYGVTLNSIGDNTVEGANVQKNLGRYSIENILNPRILNSEGWPVSGIFRHSVVGPHPPPPPHITFLCFELEKI